MCGIYAVLEGAVVQVAVRPPAGDLDEEGDEGQECETREEAVFSCVSLALFGLRCQCVPYAAT